jgi:hypothetical protein
VQLERSESSIEEEIPQRARDRPKRELFPRNLAFVEQLDLQALGPRTEVEIEQP